jgi:chromosome partitioning protein
MYVALGEATGSTRPIEQRFKKFVCEARELFDVVIVDCHPAGSIFTKTALQNSDHVIIPVVPEGYSVRGIGLMMKFIDAQKIGVAGPTPHILFNRVPTNGLSVQENQIRANARYAPHCFTRTLKKYSVFADPREGRGFAWHSGKPWSTTAFHNLNNVTEEVVTRLKI